MSEPRPSTQDPLGTYLAGVLRGALPRWPGAAADATGALVEAASVHGVDALLVALADSQPAWSTWPRDLRAGLRLRCAKSKALERARHAALARALSALEDADVPTLVLKGAALGHTRYPAPWARPRNDTDLWVREADRGRAGQALETAGLRPERAAGGEVATYQQTYGTGLTDRIDLHWRLSNAQWFANLLAFDEVHARAEPTPSLGGHARVLTPPEALLHAAAHRAVHLNVLRQAGGESFAEGDRLIWLYDMHLLAAAMGEADWERLVMLATRGRARAVTAAALGAVGKRLPLDVPEHILAALTAPGDREPSARYLTKRGLGRLPLELAALDGRSRVRMLIDIAFPPADYMLARAGTTRRWLLPWLYVDRAVRGLLKNLRPQRRASDGQPSQPRQR